MYPLHDHVISTRAHWGETRSLPTLVWCLSILSLTCRLVRELVEDREWRRTIWRRCPPSYRTTRRLWRFSLSTRSRSSTTWRWRPTATSRSPPRSSRRSSLVCSRCLQPSVLFFVSSCMHIYLFLVRHVLHVLLWELPMRLWTETQYRVSVYSSVFTLICVLVEALLYHLCTSWIKKWWKHLKEGCWGLWVPSCVPSTSCRFPQIKSCPFSICWTPYWRTWEAGI